MVRNSEWSLPPRQTVFDKERHVPVPKPFALDSSSLTLVPFNLTIRGLNTTRKHYNNKKSTASIC